MTLEKWIIQPGETRVIDIETVRKLKVSLVGGQIDVVAHDEPGARIEVHSVTGKDLRIEVTGDVVEIDHPQLRWDNFLEVFKNFGSGGPEDRDQRRRPPRRRAHPRRRVGQRAGLGHPQRRPAQHRVGRHHRRQPHRRHLGERRLGRRADPRAGRRPVSANSVSGDVAATGALRKATIDTVSGSILVDSTGEMSAVSLNTISGSGTVRLDEGLPANYVVHSVSGRLQVDGVVRSGMSGFTTNYAGSIGELSGRFVDVRANSVSGNLTVLRRTTVPTPDAANDADEEW